MQLVLHYTYDAWIEIPGSLDLIGELSEKGRLPHPLSRSRNSKLQIGAVEITGLFSYV